MSISNHISKLYISSNDNDSNIKALLVSLYLTESIELINNNSDFINLPALIHNNHIIEGSNAIVRYILHLKQLPVNSIIENLLNVEEFVLQPAIKRSDLLSIDKSICQIEILLKQLDTSIYLSVYLYLYPIINSIKSTINLSEYLTAYLSNFESNIYIDKANNLLVKYKAIDFNNLNWNEIGLITALQLLFTEAIRKTFLEAQSEGFDAAVIARCANPNFGDYQCNNAMAIAKIMKSKSSTLAPKQIGSLISTNVPSNKLIDSINTAPNGFINIKLSTSSLVKALADISKYGIKPPVNFNKTGKNVLVDFSSPNIAKEMHVGHLRSTIIGDCICRVLEYCEYDVLRVNHVGDWGTQFGMLITHLLEKHPDITTNPPNISDLTAIYKESKKRFDSDEVFKETSRLNVVKLQAGDPVCRQIWLLLCDISRKEFEIVYNLLDIRIKEIGESFYNPLIPDTIAELQNLNLVYEENGMLLIKLSTFDIPLILRKSDGGFGYDSTDMAAIRYRIRDLKRDWIIIITDAGQSNHFTMIYETARTAKWIDNQRLDHIGFGVVCGDDGKRFKTRSSETVRLIDLLNEARDRMKKSLVDRMNSPDSNTTTMTEEELTHASRVIGYGAVKYFDLKQNPATNYIFNYDRMLDTKGDTAVYLLFAYARLASILRKAKDEKDVIIENILQDAATTITLDHPAERALAFKILQFTDVILSVLADLQPNKLCDYLSDLSVTVTDFLTKCHVINSNERNSRLLLIYLSKLLMKKCFDLLGIDTLDRL